MDTPIGTPPPTPRSESPTGQRPHRGFSVWRIAVGLFVVLLGFSALSANLGWNWAFPEHLLQYWPVFLILLGLSMLVRPGRSPLSGAVVALLLVALVAVVVAAGFGRPPSRDTVTEDIAVATEVAATATEVNVDTGAGTLRITGGGTGAISGRFESDIADLAQSSRLTGTTQVVDIRTEGRGGWWWFGSVKNELNLALGSTLPTTLTVDGGAMKATLDLTGLPVSNLTVKSGATTLDLTLSDVPENARVALDAGVSTLNLTVPRTLGVRLSLDAGASTKRLPELSEVSEDRYESANYAASAKKVDLSIDAGASTITLHWR